MKEYSDDSFSSFISDRTCLVKFGADWCGPCHAVKPTLESVENETEVDVYDVDIDVHSDVAATYGIRSIPTVVAFKDGEAVDLLVGAYDASAYKELVKKVQ